MKRSFTDIVHLAGMSARPEYYSGRCASTSDLDSKMLEKIYKGVNEDYGKDAAKGFVNMVNNLPDYTATTFLVSFENFWANDFKFGENTNPKSYGEALAQAASDELNKTGAGYASMFGLGIMMASGREMSGFPGGKRWIAGDFLLSHNKEIDLPKDEHKKLVGKLRFGENYDI